MFLLHQSRVLETTDSKEEAISIIGAYGLEDHLSKVTLKLLVHLTASLVPKLYQFGKQFPKWLVKLTESTNQTFCYPTRSTAVDLELYKITSANI